MLRIDAFEDTRTDLQPEPIHPSWIKEGSPVARSVRITESADQKLITGLWDCTAGKFQWIYWFDEIVHILEGEVRVDDGTRTHVLVPGSVAHFPSGLETVWEVPKYVRKMFVLRAPEERSTLRRVASVIRRHIRERAGR